MKVWIELKAEGSALFVWQSLSIMGRIVPVEYAKRAKYQPPAMRVRDGCYTKKSPFRYNEVVQAYHNERKGDFNG